MFVNKLSRFEVLDEGAMETLDRGWRRIVSELGIEFGMEESLEYFRAAGQQVDGQVVRFDPDFIIEQVAKAPAEFDLVARNPANTVRMGGENMVFSAVYGPPFIREGDVRRDATLDDFKQLTKLVQRFDDLDTPGGVICEPNDTPLDSRHLDMQLALSTLTDKPYFGSVISGTGARDSIRMAEIVFGRSLEETVMLGIINVNSPLRYDDRMLEALHVLAAAGQAPIITPFLLMGAMSPVSIAATIAQQTAEAFAGIALAQLIRPGTPVVLGSFLSSTNMQSGSPSFGGPESALSLFCTGQIARKYKLPWRAGGGGLTASQTVDAQAAYEAMNTMLPAFLAGANLVMHSAGWLESGLVACYEKFIVDIEILRTLQGEFTAPVITEETLAFDAHLEVGHGGHFLGCAHTLERFRDCFYRPILSSTDNYERWARNGKADAAQRAGDVWRKELDAYELPAMDDGVRQELEEYVVRRRTELGD
ncbi:MAG: trimethylamine---corrinoid protein Co-methyltransferase [Gaiellales bacterium]|jgi:trimethylamine--corrinoid protein Co-methyltransferase|nr:trimethylamine---corrinoid protein Co-methyltransferase [Gaiellales bacterium]